MPPPPSFFGFPGFDALPHVPLRYAPPPPQLPSAKTKGPPRQKFSVQEDELLRDLVAEIGVNNWAEVSARLGTRSARQCRERFKNYLSPNLRNGQWTEDEDTLLREKFLEFGAKWSLIVAFFPSRSEVNLKNRWTQLQNRGAREHDLEQEKIRVIQDLDNVIAGVDLQSPTRGLADRSDGESIDWDFSDSGHGFDFLRHGFE
jgi:hypothetical protein